jgi:hypothetical protein
MKKKNERNAGRKPKFTVPSKTVLVPEPILQDVENLSKPFLNEKNK